MRINFVAQVVLGSISGSTQTGSSLCVPSTIGEETSCYKHRTTVHCGSSAASARFALVTDCAGTLQRLGLEWDPNSDNLPRTEGGQSASHLPLLPILELYCRSSQEGSYPEV